ncbi:hypothetical protein BLS_009083, partial [Venturia inaequalis]
NHGTTFNLVAFVTTPNPWPDHSKSTLPAHRSEAIKDFQGFGPNVMKLLDLVQPDLDIWGIFDLEHPLDTFCKGKICVVGDAAHATSPHHGSGAGFCIEDAAVMASILEDPLVTGAPGTIEKAFQTYSKERKVRTQCRSPRRICTIAALDAAVLIVDKVHIGVRYNCAEAASIGQEATDALAIYKNPEKVSDLDRTDPRFEVHYEAITDRLRPDVVADMALLIKGEANDVVYADNEFFNTYNSRFEATMVAKQYKEQLTSASKDQEEQQEVQEEAQHGQTADM